MKSRGLVTTLVEPPHESGSCKRNTVAANQITCCRNIWNTICFKKLLSMGGIKIKNLGTLINSGGTDNILGAQIKFWAINIHFLGALIKSCFWGSSGR